MFTCLFYSRSHAHSAHYLKDRCAYIGICVESGAIHLCTHHYCQQHLWAARRRRWIATRPLWLFNLSHSRQICLLLCWAPPSSSCPCCYCDNKPIKLPRNQATRPPDHQAIRPTSRQAKLAKNCQRQCGHVCLRGRLPWRLLWLCIRSSNWKTKRLARLADTLQLNIDSHLSHTPYL